MLSGRSISGGVRQGYLWMLRTISPAAFGAAGVLMITVFALFVPPYIGMADNGDFFRVAYSNGIYFNHPDYDSQYFDYFVKQYGIFQYFNENGATINSSQSLFIKLALMLNKLVFSSTVFDLRFQAVIYAVLYTAAVYLLIEGLTWGISRRKGYLIALIALFIFGDTGYTAYFSSFYSEAIVLIMAVFLFASWLLMYRKRYNDYVLLAIFVISAVLLTTSKQQNAPVGMIAAVMGVSLLFLRSGRTFRILTGCSLVVFMGAGVLTYTMISKEFVNINAYHAMTRGVLMQSVDPEKTLQSFGIDEQYALLKDSIYYEPYSTIDVNSPMLEREFYSKYGFASILKYYVLHPGRLWAILDVAAKGAFTIRPEAMGNFEQSTGAAPGTHTHFFSLYSLLKERVLPKTFGFIVLWGIVVMGLYLPAFVKAMKERNFRHIQKLILVVSTLIIGLSGIFVSIIGAGDADLAKHEFLFTLSFDLILLLLVADLIGRSLFIHPDPAVRKPNSESEVPSAARPAASASAAAGQEVAP
ncbi:hypothetical protein AWM70_20270 [Paenibacillus yonginensis]|uniref:Glycosyltransferase RgtA/B/C/D-like domain-containing protein n=1 Tax=Paenibacillus yonginensis TaxID=1462996 RepID=A0A1B1N5G2_9BACL|nr:hypothetical protein [Paenibacillus yonginensis]ANS76625.1 hypothetical protein AWM70_20270 [Paenibacillus yonginensis]